MTDELALDLHHAVEALAGSTASSGISDELLATIVQLDQRPGALGPGDPAWRAAALDRHPVWAEARAVAQRVLPQLPPT